jgi:hypothetical protein
MARATNTVGGDASEAAFWAILHQPEGRAPKV